jgi:hypothetical protein
MSDTHTVYSLGQGFRSVAMVDGQIVTTGASAGPNTVTPLALRALRMSPEFVAAEASGRVLVMPPARWESTPEDAVLAHIRDVAQYDQEALTWLRNTEGQGPRRPRVMHRIYQALANDLARAGQEHTARYRRAERGEAKWRVAVDALPADAVEVSVPRDRSGEGWAACGAGYEGMCGGHGGPENTASYWRWRADGCPHKDP